MYVGMYMAMYRAGMYAPKAREAPEANPADRAGGRPHPARSGRLGVDFLQTPVDKMICVAHSLAVNTKKGHATMNRAKALEIARSKYAAFSKAEIDGLMGRNPRFDAKAEFGYDAGWFKVGEFAFNRAEVANDGATSNHGPIAWL